MLTLLTLVTRRCSRTTTAPHIGNLFDDLDMSSLPDAINGPTQTRLNRFLRDDLKLAITAPELSVRGIVDEMMKFNASGSLCWDVFGRNSHCRSKAPSLMKTMSAQVELRRVASRCAAYIFSKAEADMSAQVELHRVASRCAAYIFSKAKEADPEHHQADKAKSGKTLRERANAKACDSLEWFCW